MSQTTTTYMATLFGLYDAGSRLIEGGREVSWRRHEQREQAGDYPRWFAPDARERGIDKCSVRARSVLGHRLLTAINATPAERDAAVDALRTYVRGLANPAAVAAAEDDIVVDGDTLSVWHLRAGQGRMDSELLDGSVRERLAELSSV